MTAEPLRGSTALYRARPGLAGLGPHTEARVRHTCAISRHTPLGASHTPVKRLFSVHTHAVLRQTRDRVECGLDFRGWGPGPRV